jgi:hypothetical protein
MLWYYAECHILFIIMLNVVMLSLVMLSVVALLYRVFVMQNKMFIKSTPGPNVIRLFTTVTKVRIKLECLSLVSFSSLL